MNNGTVRVALHSRRLMMREALAGYLRASSEFTVVGHAASITELGAVCQLRRPDLALVDLTCVQDEVAGSLVDLRTLCEQCPDVDVVGLYEQWTAKALRAARQAGVTAVMPASRGLDALLAVLRDQAGLRRRPRQDQHRLTDCELDVVWLMNSGHNVAEMADLLRISRRTVENRKRSIYAKLDAHSQCAAIARTTSLGITEAPGAVYRPAPTAPLPRRRIDPRRPVVALVRGEPGKATDEVVRTLLAGNVACALDRTGSFLAVTHLIRAYDGPVVAVLIAPALVADALACESLGVPIVVVCPDRPNRTEALHAMVNGAAAVIAVDDVPAQLLPLLAVLAAGYVAIGAGHVSSALERLAFADKPRRPELTARESEILASIERGESVRQTARSLGIAGKTVENIQARMFRKLGVRNRVGALAAARRLGLIGVHRGGEKPLGALRD